MNEEVFNRLSIGTTTTMGARSQHRLPRPIESRGSMETTNIDDRQSLFRPLDRPKLQEFGEISEIMGENVFVGMNINK